MEKFMQYRDKGTGIAPFFPNPTETSRKYLSLHVFLFVIRFSILAPVFISYFAIFQWLPVGSLFKKAYLWLMLGIPGVWWIDLQIDGIRRGSLAKHNKTKLPQPSSVIASSFTSPIDSLYLAAIFDPIFTASYPSTPLVHQISLFHALLRAFQFPQLKPPKDAILVELSSLMKLHPKRIFVLYPECTTTNGRGILQFNESLLTAPMGSRIFPVNLRYTPADITTPLPGQYLAFCWRLLSKPTHCIRVRIAESVSRASLLDVRPISDKDMATNSTENFSGSGKSDRGGSSDRELLIKIAEALARLGRTKRVGLSANDKVEFIDAWENQRSKVKK